MVPVPGPIRGYIPPKLGADEVPMDGMLLMALIMGVVGFMLRVGPCPCMLPFWTTALFRTVGLTLLLFVCTLVHVCVFMACNSQTKVACWAALFCCVSSFVCARWSEIDYKQLLMSTA